MKKVLTYTAIIIALGASDALASGGLKSSPSYNKASYDIQFLDTMIVHHNQGAEVAQIAANKSQNKQIKSHAQARIDLLQEEINEMQSARDDIQENAAQAINLDFDGMDDVDVKSFRRQSGKLDAKDFNQKYLKLSIKHEEGGLVMAQDAVKHSKDSAVKKIAQDLATEGTKEIAELKDLLKNQ